VKAQVENQPGCNGITLQSDGKYTGRKGTTAVTTNSNESSWILDPTKICHGGGVAPDPYITESGETVTGCRVRAISGCVKAGDMPRDTGCKLVNGIGQGDLPRGGCQPGIAPANHPAGLIEGVFYERENDPRCTSGKCTVSGHHEMEHGACEVPATGSDYSDDACCSGECRGHKCTASIPLDNRCCSGLCEAGTCTTPPPSDFPNYGKLHNFDNKVPDDVGQYAQDLPTDKRWNGGWASHAAGRYPICRIPYGETCNFGKNGECCWGDSKCTNDFFGGASCTTPTQNNLTTPHDPAGADIDGCDIQPGGFCDITGKAPQCCKNYSDFGGKNYGCQKNWTGLGQSLCREDKDVVDTSNATQDLFANWEEGAKYMRVKNHVSPYSGFPRTIPDKYQTQDDYGYWPAKTTGSPNATIPYGEYCRAEDASCENGPCCWGDSKCTPNNTVFGALDEYHTCTTPEWSRARDPRGFNGLILKPESTSTMLKCDLMAGSSCSMKGQDGLCCKDYSRDTNSKPLYKETVENQKLKEKNPKGGRQGELQCIPDGGIFWPDSGKCVAGNQKFLTHKEINDMQWSQLDGNGEDIRGNAFKCMFEDVGGDVSDCLSISQGFADLSKPGVWDEFGFCYEKEYGGAFIDGQSSDLKEAKYCITVGDGLTADITKWGDDDAFDDDDDDDDGDDGGGDDKRRTKPKPRRRKK
jgi:hypothetical protein